MEGVCSEAPPGVLASGQQSPAGIVLDDASVYWMDVGSQRGGSARQVAGHEVRQDRVRGRSHRAVLWLVDGSDAARPLRWHSLLGGQRRASELLHRWMSPAGPTVLSTGNFTPTDLAVCGATGIFVGASDTTGTAPVRRPLCRRGRGSDRRRRDARSFCGAGRLPMRSRFTGPPSTSPWRGRVARRLRRRVRLLLRSCCPQRGQPTALAAAGTDVYIYPARSPPCMTGGETNSPGEVAWCPEANCMAGLMTLTSRATYVQGIAADGTSVQYFTDRGAVATARSRRSGPHSGIGSGREVPARRMHRASDARRRLRQLPAADRGRRKCRLLDRLRVEHRFERDDGRPRDAVGEVSGVRDRLPPRRERHRRAPRPLTRRRPRPS